MGSSAVLLAVLAVAGCTKEKSQAVLAYEGFADGIARSQVEAARKFAVEGIEFEIAANRQGEPQATDGRAVHQPLYDPTMARVFWVKGKVESEKKDAAGGVQLVTLQDVCRQDPEASACTRPDVYRHRVLMRQEGGAWKVAGFTEELVNSPR